MTSKLFSNLIYLAASSMLVFGISSRYVKAYGSLGGLPVSETSGYNLQDSNQYQYGAGAVAQYSSYGLGYYEAHQYRADGIMQDSNYRLRYANEYSLRYSHGYLDQYRAYAKDSNDSQRYPDEYTNRVYAVAQEAKYYSQRYPDAYYADHYRVQNASSLVSSNENRVRTDARTYIAWQWDNNPVSVLNAIRMWPYNRNEALTILKEGQGPNRGVQRLYDVAAETLPDFWELVFYTTWSGANFTQLKSQLVWQYKNDPDSLVKSKKAWDATPKQEIWAYYRLLWGQRTNPKALQVYRACWNDNRDEVMAMVSSMLRK